MGAKATTISDVRHHEPPWRAMEVRELLHSVDREGVAHGESSKRYEVMCKEALARTEVLHNLCRDALAALSGVLITMDYDPVDTLALIDMRHDRALAVRVRNATWPYLRMICPAWSSAKLKRLEELCRAYGFTTRDLVLVTTSDIIDRSA